MEPTLDDFQGLGTYVSEVYAKTAAERAGESLVMPAYIAGIESVLMPYDDGEAIAKVAAEELGRTVMGEIIPDILRDKA